MPKFKEGQAVYILNGGQAHKGKIIKVLPTPMLHPITPQRYIVSGGGIATILVSAMGDSDQVVNENEIVERGSNDKPAKKKASKSKKQTK